MIEDTYRLPVMDTVKAAWRKVSGTKGTIWAVFITFFIVLALLWAIEKYVMHNVLTNFITFIVQVAMYLSLTYLGIRRAQDIPINYNMIKDVLTFRLILYYIGLTILKALIFAPVAIIEYILVTQVGLFPIAADGSIPLSGMTTLVGFILILPFIYLGIRMFLGEGMLLDKKSNPWEAIKLSFRATKNNVWNLFWTIIIVFCISILILITLGIAFIWILPWTCILYGEVYNRLARNRTNLAK